MFHKIYGLLLRFKKGFFQFMDKKVTIYDIATAAGVSPATVSRMIHQPNIVTKTTREKILEAFSDYGIRPEDLAIKKTAAKSAKTSADAGSRAVLVCIPIWENPFYDDILAGIENHLKQHHYHMIITREIPQRSTIFSFINYCSNLNIAGLVIMYAIAEDLLRQLKSAFPIVQCSEYNPLYRPVPYVSIDDYAITKAAIAYLIKTGCKRIGFFSAPFDYRYVQDRYRAYKSTLLSNGLSVDPDYIIQVSGYSYKHLLESAYRLFRLPKLPDAVFATSDIHAHAMINAAQRSGIRVPEELKVFGFDNTNYATLSTPTISTIEQPRLALGVQSAELLLKMIAQPSAVFEPVLLPTKIILREST